MKRNIFTIYFLLLLLSLSAQALKGLKIVYRNNGSVSQRLYSLDSIPEWGYKAGLVFVNINGQTRLQVTKSNFVQVEYPNLIDTVVARSAYDFFNSMGVGTHLGYGTTTYGNFDQLTYPLLKELGIKHIRDGYGGTLSRTEQDRRYKILGGEGIKILFCTGTATLASLMPNIKGLLPYLSGVEGSNEVDFSYNRDVTQWKPISISRQQILYDSIKNNPKTRSLPVVNFSLAEINTAASIVGDQSNKIDYGNMHIYAAAKHPALHWGNGLTENQALGYAKLVSGTKPLIMTECGYHNYVAYPQNHAGAPEEVSAIYIPHLFFEYFNMGITRSYIYELLDQNQDVDGDKELHFGMVRYDGTRKPVFNAVKNLISLMSDDTNITPSPLGFKLYAQTQSINNNLRYTLLQKSNGSWWIAVFRAESIFNTQTLVTTTLQSEKINLLFAKNASEINIYMPNKSVDKQFIFNNKASIDFDLGSELVLIEIIL